MRFCFFGLSAAESVLRISIVASAVYNVNSSVLYMVYETVFFIDAAAVFALQIAGQRFGFSDAFPAAVALDVLNKLIDAF